MKKIKSFILDVSQIQGFKKYAKASSIKDRFHNLVKEFEAVMTDLHFSLAVANEEQRRLDQESLNDDIEQMKHAFLQEVKIMKDKIDQFTEQKRPDLPIYETLKATTIDTSEIKDPLIVNNNNRRGKKEPFIYKKYYKTMDVACIPRSIPEDETHQAKKIQAQLAILGKLKDSPNILKFFGISHLENQMVMVVEWAELGSLREVYNRCDIAWPAKVQIALDICRGITFLHTCAILHHDIRCANIMMTLRLEPKITGFEYARLTNSATTSMSELTDVVHWLAPEKLKFAKEQPYNTKCEIFREKLRFGRDKPEIEELQQEYKKIIVAAWQEDPQIRASLQFLFLELNRLAHKYYDPRNTSPTLKPDKSIDLDGTLHQVSVSDSKEEDLPDFGDEFCLDSLESLPEIRSLEEGISAHKKKETKKAWEIFCEHANLGNTRAKYWKGYYLWEGYAGERDRKQASKLFKDAADDGLADAQLRYAFSLVGNQGSKFDRKLFIEYLTKAADNNNSTAQFNLGDLYLNGKLGIQRNIDLGKKYLRLAALTNQPKAIEILQKLGINIYNDNKSEDSFMRDELFSPK
ncbi:3330_t:CDS:2 [Funneliformis mosseae]|uniref:3330_t:CDS:1 n=1 Tax=Funneliformis mosseae TaxID=27381 RepID=A0A9N9FWV8_FUNMO|nr:3330_t:CDS:2 [Funneliformis mosseae]